MDKSLLFYVENIHLPYRLFSNDNYTSSDASIQHCGTLFRNFRFYRFFDDRTGSGHFQVMFPNIVIRKSIVSRRKRGLSNILNNFRFYRFFADKTGSGHFSGMVPILSIRKSTITRQMRGLLTIFRSLPVFHR